MEDGMELLIRVDERSKNIEDMMNKFISKADNGGFVRCADRGARLIDVEDTLEKLDKLDIQGRLSSVEDKVGELEGCSRWLKRGSIGAVFTAVVTAIASALLLH